MSRKPLDRKHGIQLGRLPNYQVISDADADRHPNAIKLCKEMQIFVAQKAIVRVNGKQSSDRTIQASIDVMNEVCCRLWRLGFRVETVSQIGGKHIEAVIRDYWACGASPKYFATLYSTLNKFQGWVGKPGLIKNRNVYLPEVSESEFRTYRVTLKSKSWEQNGVDVEEKIIQADAIDIRFGLMLRMMSAFGLRRSEVLQIKPWLDDKIFALEIRPGVAKGGRPRNIHICDANQREVLNYVKSKIAKTEFLGWPAKTYDEKNLLLKNKTRFMYFMKKLGLTKHESGVTVHGLRAGYAEKMALHYGWTPATLGGVKNQIPRDEETLIRMKVAENLGHSRTSVTSAYFGSATNKIQNSRGVRIATLILACGDHVAIHANPPPRDQLDGQYPKLKTREIESTDLLLVLETFVDRLSMEKAQFKLKIVGGLVTVLPFDELAGAPFDPQSYEQIKANLQLVLSNFGYL
jgi:integrase